MRQFLINFNYSLLLKAFYESNRLKAELGKSQDQIKINEIILINFWIILLIIPNSES